MILNPFWRCYLNRPTSIVSDYSYPMTHSLQLHRQTHIASLAVEEPVPASDAANAAALAVVLLLVFIVKQVADQTCILKIAKFMLWISICKCSFNGCQAFIKMASSKHILSIMEEFGLYPTLQLIPELFVSSLVWGASGSLGSSWILYWQWATI